MANIFWKKRETDNRKRALESTRGFLHRLKISWTLVHKRFKIASEFSPTLRKFCIVLPTRCTRKPNPTKRCQTGGNKWCWCEPNKVAPHTECKCNHRNNVSIVSEAPKHFKLTIASRRAAFSGNTSLIATFSSFILFYMYGHHYNREIYCLYIQNNYFLYQFLNSFSHWPAVTGVHTPDCWCCDIQ